MFDFGWYVYKSQVFSLRVKVLRESPYWAVVWAGLIFTNANVPLLRILLRETAKLKLL